MLKGFSINKTFGLCKKLATETDLKIILQGKNRDHLLYQRTPMTTHLLPIERADWPKLHNMFEARDAKTWQRKFPVGFPSRVGAFNFLFNIFHHFVVRIDSRCVIKAKYVLLIRSILRAKNLPWYKTGLVSRQVLHLLSKLQNWIWPKTGQYKTCLVSNTKIEASIRATKLKPWQSHLTSETVELFKMKRQV